MVLWMTKDSPWVPTCTDCSTTALCAAPYWSSLLTRRGATLPPGGEEIDSNAEYDKLATLVRKHLDMELVYRVTGLN